MFESQKFPFASQLSPGQIFIAGPMHVAMGLVLSWLAITASAGSSTLQVLKPTQESSIASHQIANGGEVRPLEAGIPVERELAGGDIHRYAVSLSAGTFLHAIVDQHGIDAVVAAFAVDGKKIIEVDTPNGSHGRRISRAT